MCRPCIEHHIPAGRDAGLTERELARTVEVAQATHRIATELLFRLSDELLRSTEVSAGVPPSPQSASRLDELAALGASIGANCHPLLEQNITAALQQGLTASQVRSAIKMAEFVGQHAAEVTAGKAAAALEAAGPIRRLSREKEVHHSLTTGAPGLAVVTHRTRCAHGAARRAARRRGVRPWQLLPGMPVNLPAADTAGTHWGQPA